MRVRLINRRDTEVRSFSSSHDNIFSDVSELSAPRGIPAQLKQPETAQILRPDAFSVAQQMPINKASPDQMKGVSCFHGAAQIITQCGSKQAKNLTTQDKVLTRDNGFQSVLWVGVIEANDAKPMTVELAPDAVMAGKPDQAVRVSGRQCVLLSCPEVQSQFGSAEVLARAGDLLHLDGISQVECDAPFVAVLTEQHELLNVSGLWMDSLLPDSEAQRHISKNDKRTIADLLPELGALPINRSYPSARTLLREEFARQFTR